MLRCVRNLIPCVCVILVFAFLFLGANPTHASENLNASVGIEPSLTLTLPTAALNLALDPSTTTFGYKDLPISVATNNETGYVMTVSTAGNNTDLVNTTDSNIVLETLPALAGGYTDSTFVVNKWGYKNGLANNYFPFVSGDTVLSNAGPTNGDSTTLRFGTKIDYMQPEGTYSTTFNFSLTVNPIIHYMQDFTPAMCKALASAGDYTVVDRRDDKEYAVRWIDGECWMTQNLRFVGDYNTKSMTLDSATSDVESSYTASNPLQVTYSYLTGLDSASAPAIQESSNTSYGVYYNYPATTANQITSTTAAEATRSVCPAGWKLPNEAELRNIVIHQTEFEPVAGGVYWERSIANPGRGYWWGSTVNTDLDGRYYLIYDGSTLSAAADGGRKGGRYVRCVLKDTRTISNIANMQDINLQIAANTTNGATKTLKDTRDNQEYTVEKINGNIWMTKNLAIGCDGSGSTYGDNMVVGGKTLTPQDSNVSSSWNTDSALSLDRADNTTNCTTSSTSDCDSYTTPRMKCSATYGAWYNYAAASAMTITGASSSVQQVDDVCPVGWRLPSQTEMAGIVSYQTAFNPIAAGNYNGGSLIYPGYANWWTATRYNNTSYYILYYDSSSLSATIQIERYYGRNIRCIAK